MRIAWLAAATFVGGALGLSSNAPEVKANFPAPCPRFKCTDLIAYWDGTPGLIGASYVAMPGGGPIAIAYDDIYLPQSIKNGPSVLAVPAENYNLYTYDFCSPFCGKNGFPLQWQAPQEVGKIGARSMNPAINGIPKRVCAPLRAGQQVGDPSNTPNSNTNSPPLKPDETPGGG